MGAYEKKIAGKLLWSNVVFYLEIFLYLLSFICFFYFLTHGNTFKAFKCVVMATLLIVSRVLPKTLHIHLNDVLKILVLLFIFMAMFLAELLNFYKTIPNYDKVLHSISGALFFFIGQGLFRRLNNVEGNASENKLMMVFFSLFFSISVAGCWEIFEFSMDRFFGLTLQNNSLMDTMMDIICSTVVASVTTTIILILGKNEKRSVEYDVNEIQYLTPSLFVSEDVGHQ